MPSKKKPAGSEAKVEALVLLLASGVTKTGIEDAREKLQIAKADLPKLLTEARSRIRQAATFKRAEELGMAITRLRELYARSVRIQDNRTALAAQRELNQLVGLYPEQDTGLGATSDDAGSREGLGIRDSPSDEIEAIAAHLLSLELAPADYPLREHARIAADIVREHRAET